MYGCCVSYFERQIDIDPDTVLRLDKAEAPGIKWSGKVYEHPFACTEVTTGNGFYYVKAEEHEVAELLLTHAYL
jgi:hypothetical protein